MKSTSNKNLNRNKVSNYHCLPNYGCCLCDFTALYIVMQFTFTVSLKTLEILRMPLILLKHKAGIINYHGLEIVRGICVLRGGYMG